MLCCTGYPLHALSMTAPMLYDAWPWETLTSSKQVVRPRHEVTVEFGGLASGW